MKYLAHIMAGLALIGVGDASYLTAHHYLGAPLRCGVGFDCTAVTSSAYATWFGVPVALLGVIFYVAVLILSLVAIEGKESKIGKRALGYACLIAPAGIIASLWFVGVQAFILKAWCQWCLLSAATSTALFFCSFVYYRRFKTFFLVQQ